MMSYWASFAKTGDPNSGGAASAFWPAWSETQQIINISAAPSVVKVPLDSYVGCQWFDREWDFLGGCLPPDDDA